MTIDQQVALDEALVPHASRLRIGKGNFYLRSDITSKESTLQVVYDVLRLALFNKAFLVTADTFDELPFEEEILAFLRNLRHSGEIKKITDDFVYQVEHKDAKKSNEIYYPRFTKVIINFFMTKDVSISRRSKVNWHYVRDDQMFTTIKLVSRHQNTQSSTPKTKASVRKTQSSSDTTMTPPTTTGTRLSTSVKGKQPAKSSKAKGVPDVPTYEYDEEISWKSSDEDDDDDVDDQSDANDDDQKDEDNFDPIIQTPSHVENSDDEGNDDAIHGMNVGGNEGLDAEDDDNELYGDININLEGRDVQMTDVHTTQVFEDTHVTLTPVNPDGQQQSSSVSSQFVTSMLNLSPDTGIDSLFESTHQVDVPVMTTVEPLLLSAPTLPPPSIPIISQVQQAPAPSPTTTLSTSLQDLPNFGSLFRFDHRLKTLKANFFEFMQTNQFAEAVSSILAQAENEDFLNKLDQNIQKIIKEQVKVQVSKILPKIGKTVNEQLEAEVLTRASNSSKISYVVAVDLSKLQLKKILIEKMESNKSIHRSDEQTNLYKALVDAYECDKIIMDTYGDTVTLERRRDDEDKDEEPSDGSDRGDLAKQADSRTSFNELMDTPVDFSAFLMNRLKVDTLTLELLAGPTYELMKGSCKSLLKLEFFLEEVYKATTDQLDWNNPEGQQYPHNLLKPLPLIPNSRGRRVIPFDHFINNNLEYLPGGASSQKYTTSVTKKKVADYGHIKWIEDLFYEFVVNRESARYVYSKRRIIAVTELQIVEWNNYKHLDWITVRKLTNLIVEERFAFNVSLRMFTKSFAIQRRVEDLQLGVESYQKKLNLTKLETYRSDLKRKEAYIAYSNPRGFIYQNKDKQNRLMRIDELHKFSDGTLNDIRTALDDHLKVIRIKYLPQTIWRRSDKERAAAMIQAIDKQLKTRRIMQSLEKFVGRSSRIHRTLKAGGEGTYFQLSQRFIAACSYPTIKYKDIMKAQVHVSRHPLL
nr:hypothetical protein [Tanacetum cinerariifolium]